MNSKAGMAASIAWAAAVAVLLATGAVAAPLESLDFGRFGRVTVYRAPANRTTWCCSCRVTVAGISV